MKQEPLYTEEELQAIEQLLSSSEEEVQQGLSRIQSTTLPERLSIALYTVMRFYNNAPLVHTAYDLLATYAKDPLRSLIQQYPFLRQPEDDGDETTRKTLYAYLEEEAGFDPQLYANAIVRITQFFCQRIMNSLQDMMEGMEMNPQDILIKGPFDLDSLELDLTLDEGLFTVTNETAYLNNSHRDASFTALDFTTQHIKHLQVYPSSVFMDLSMSSKDLAGIQQLTLIESDRPLLLPNDLAEAPHLQQIALHNIESYAPQTWSILEDCPKIHQLEVQLPLEHTRPPVELFELSQITHLQLEGPALRLDFPIVLLGNLRHLSIPVSTLEGSAHLFRQLKTLHHLEQLDLHPALEEAYQAYLLKPRV